MLQGAIDVDREAQHREEDEGTEQAQDSPRAAAPRAPAAGRRRRRRPGRPASRDRTSWRDRTSVWRRAWSDEPGNRQALVRAPGRILIAQR